MSFWVWSGFSHVGAGAVNVYTLAADPGSYAVTGTAATLSTTRLLVADAGSVAVTGTDASLVVGRMVAADAGAVAIVGTDATLLATRLLVADAGAVDIIGTAATLAVGRTLVADAGSVVVTGTAADLIYAQGATLTADPGSYAITGTAADLVRGFVLAADAGAIVVTGTAATFLRGYTFTAEAGTVTIATPVETLLTYRGALLGLPLAELHYPRIIQPHRWATNGRPPDVRFLRALIRSQNHAMAYRRKTFLRWGDLDSPPDGLSGDVTRFRWRCHTGYGATHIGLVLGLGLDNKASGASPAVQLEITPVGGAATTVTSTGGASTTGTDDYPSQILWRREKLAVSPNTTYECRLITKDYGRIVSVCAYEIASPFVDPRKDYYVGEQPGVEAPVTDTLRERILVGLSSMWRRNGSHLYSWPGDPSGTQPTFATSTWTNIIDGSTTSSSSTPGFALGDADEVTLLSQPRRSKADALDVVLAAHGSVATGSGGEVRLLDNNGTAWMTLTGIGTTSQWYATTGTISLDGITKLDAQARATSSTLTLNALSLYTYA